MVRMVSVGCECIHVRHVRMHCDCYICIHVYNANSICTPKSSSPIRFFFFSFSSQNNLHFCTVSSFESITFLWSVVSFSYGFFVVQCPFTAQCAHIHLYFGYLFFLCMLTDSIHIQMVYLFNRNEKQTSIISTLLDIL